ncbi:putative B3 domain-containing protein Os03g0621600 [Papaver somniferum]|uniref:putative B3 domain-containing protein Os03g0621600 n=1 Tax=Papaver somniferum TaxID=3469 RepID=UPI000E6FA240|nr:putative B3 domain-containing protein Os03g0621600 [Papaver somniferum]
MKRNLESKTMKRPSFFKVLIKEDFRKRLRVPRAFMKHLNGKLPKTCILRISSISSSSSSYNGWTIKMEKIASGSGANYLHDLVFSCGWPEFVNHHFLEWKDFLVFTYKGKSEFNVDIYGRNGCLKELHLENKGTKALHGHNGYWAHDGQRKAIKPWGMTQRNKVGGESTEHSFPVIWRQPEKMRIPRVWVEKIEGLQNKKCIVLKDPKGRLWRLSMQPQKDGCIDIRKGWADFSIGNRLTEGTQIWRNEGV